MTALNEKGIRVLLYLSPIHPIIRESPVVDDDGTTREGYQELVGWRSLKGNIPTLYSSIYCREVIMTLEWRCSVI